MTALVIRPAAALLVALSVAGCGGAAQVSSSSPDPSVAASALDGPPSPSDVATTAPSQAAPSDGSVASVCLEADILAALEAYRRVEIPDDPSMEEVADALEALELEGKAAGYRDGVVAAFRGETGETLDSMKLHDAIFSLIPLQSEIDLVEC